MLEYTKNSKIIRFKTSENNPAFEKFLQIKVFNFYKNCFNALKVNLHKKFLIFV